MSSPSIQIRGANEHNLKSLDVDIPLNELTVITGPSGCGKSSLAFDTLHAEGKRRFMESLSSYARQFMEQFQKAQVDEITNIPPAIGLSQHNPVTNARATVGANIEAVDYLAQFFYSVGERHCASCGSTDILDGDPDTLLTYFFDELTDGDTVYLCLSMPRKHVKKQYDYLISQGFDRLIDSDLKPVSLSAELPTFSKNLVHDDLRILFLLDRFKYSESKQDVLNQRFREAYFRLERVKHELEHIDDAHFVALNKSGDTTSTIRLPMGSICFSCHTPFERMQVQHFHYMTPQGACDACEGFGRTMGLDEQRVIPNPKATLREGALHCFSTPSYTEFQFDLEDACRREGIPLDLPWDALKVADQTKVWDGFSGWMGVRPFFKYLESKKYKMHVRMLLARYRGYFTCQTCNGSRLIPQARATVAFNRSLDQWLQLPAKELLAFLKDHETEAIELTRDSRLGKDAWDFLIQRLEWLGKVGLGYLPLLRPIRTLSSGEAQRVQLISSIGSELTETLYVLDEPTVGLHPRDTEHLINVLQELRKLGNTVVMVEHDADVMRAADSVIDLGPGSGSLGGELVYQGTFEQLLESNTQTAQGLTTPLKRENESDVHLSSQKWLRLYQASGYNLKHISVSFPLGQLTCISGVSGAGKSSLILQTLYGHYLSSQSELPSFEVLPCKGIEGIDTFTGGVILVDQTPPSRSSRSNPATVVKAYDEIRKLFAGAAKAQALGISPGHFSFNSKGGRCDTCEGLGYITVDMQFMADMHMTCPDCSGKRFQDAVLSIELFGKNIDDVLKMTVQEAMQFFKTAEKVRSKLLPLLDLGLGYLPMGQATATLSGGEAQRLKLAPYLPKDNKVASKPCLFIFDEPTRGLHITDIPILVKALKRLTLAGHTVIVIEHNTDFLTLAGDWFIDIGPEADTGGGHVVVEGTYDDLINCKESITASYLQR